MEIKSFFFSLSYNLSWVCWVHNLTCQYTQREHFCRLWSPRWWKLIIDRSRQQRMTGCLTTVCAAAFLRTTGNPMIESFAPSLTLHTAAVFTIRDLHEERSHFTVAHFNQIVQQTPRVVCQCRADETCLLSGEWSLCRHSVDPHMLHMCTHTCAEKCFLSCCRRCRMCSQWMRGIRSLTWAFENLLYILKINLICFPYTQRDV